MTINNPTPLCCPNRPTATSINLCKKTYGQVYKLNVEDDNNTKNEDDSDEKDENMSKIATKSSPLTAQTPTTMLSTSTVRTATKSMSMRTATASKKTTQGTIRNFHTE